MTRDEIHDFCLGLAIIALVYAVHQHHVAALKAATNTDTGGPPPGNTGIVPPGYNPTTHDYTTSLDALLQGVINDGMNMPIVIDGEA
jgi:hypothetical protein